MVFLAFFSYHQNVTMPEYWYFVVVSREENAETNFWKKQNHLRAGKPNILWGMGWQKFFLGVGGRVRYGSKNIGGQWTCLTFRRRTQVLLFHQLV